MLVYSPCHKMQTTPPIKNSKTNKDNDKQPLPLLGLDWEVKLTEFEATLFSLLSSLSCFKEVKSLKAEASLILLLFRKSRFREVKLPKALISLISLHS